MKKSIRYITLLLAAVFLISGTCLIAYADPGAGSGSAPADDGGEVVADDGGEIDPGVDAGEDPGGNSGDSGNTPGGNSGGDSGNAGGDSGNNQSGDNGGSNDTPADNQTPAADDGYVDSSAQDSGYDSGYDSNQNDSDYNSDNSSQYQYIDDSPLYYGDAGNYDYNSSSDNDRSAGKIDAEQYPATVDKTIKAQKWENLEIPGTKKDVKLNSGSADGDVSFASMKSNNASGDDMGFIPYLGIALVAMAVLGILYFIIATVSARKAYATATSSNGRGDKTASASSAPRKSKKTGKNTRYADDYDDGYSATRRGSKADTAEIHLPRRFK